MSQSLSAILLLCAFSLITANEMLKLRESLSPSINSAELERISSAPDQAYLVMIYNSSDRYSNRHHKTWSRVSVFFQKKLKVAKYDLAVNPSNKWIDEEYDPKIEILVKLFTPLTKNFGEAETYYGENDDASIKLWAAMTNEDFQKNRSIYYIKHRNELQEGCIQAKSNAARIIGDKYTNKSIQYFWIDPGRLLVVEQLFNINKSYPSVIIIDGEKNQYGRILDNFDIKSLVKCWEAALSRVWDMRAVEFIDNKSLTTQPLPPPVSGFTTVCNCLGLVFSVFVFILLSVERFGQVRLITNIIP